MSYLLAILTWFLSLFASRQAAKNEGKAEAEREQAQTVTAEVTKANEVRAEADKAHAENTGDEAFDQEFRRS